jgi:hypothetical protein
VVSYVDDIGGACVDSHTARAESILDGHMVGCGMPPAMDKLRLARETNALYLGLLWDTQLMRVSLTPDKRDKARAAAAKVAGARRMRARELQECLGVLDFTAQVQPVLAAFLGGARRCLIGRRPDAWVTISDEARADAALWLPIINAHDGHRLIPQSVREKDAPSVIVDAATTTGLGFFSPEAKLYFSMPLCAAELGDTAHIINKLEQLAAYLGFLAVAYDAAADLKNTAQSTSLPTTRRRWERPTSCAPPRKRCPILRDALPSTPLHSIFFLAPRTCPDLKTRRRTLCRGA